MPEPNLFKDALLDKDTFCVTWEQIPGRGAVKGRLEVIANAAKAASEGLVKAISVTDNPSGNPAYAAAMLGAEIKKLGIEPLVHFALRDKNRNEVESLLYGLAGAGVRNLLVMSGDYPSTAAFGGLAQPVFDLDPVHVLQLIAQMNAGLEYEGPGQQMKLPPTDFFAGVAVSPFKKLEAELMGQYFKLEKKIKAGAQFIINQVGYDARKAEELLLWLKLSGHDVPALANIYVLSYPAACLMRGNKIPGCVVNDKLLAELEKERQAPDKGKEARLMRAAKMYAVAKGLGYAGAHLGGHNLSYENIKYIAGKGEELFPRWQDLAGEFDYPQAGGFYLFQRDSKSGLNTDELAPELDKGQKVGGLQLLPPGPQQPARTLTPSLRHVPAAGRLDRHHPGRQALLDVPGTLQQEHALRLPRLRRLRPGGHRLYLPGLPVPQRRARRPLRRQLRGLV